MNEHTRQVAETCLRASENGSMSFPQIVGTLMQEGFESYAVDFRRATATYYRPDGESIVLPSHQPDAPVSPSFDLSVIRHAIKEAQQLVPGYTYAGFCRTVIRAGCAGYMVSFIGRRAVYFGRTAETHVEHFPE